MIDETKLDHEIEEIQKSMANTDADSDEYATYVKRLKELEELRRYSNQEDPETMKVKVEEAEGENNRKHRTALKIFGVVGMAGLMFLSHFLQATQIMERADEKFIDKFDRDKDI